MSGSLAPVPSRMQGHIEWDILGTGAAISVGYGVISSSAILQASAGYLHALVGGAIYGLGSFITWYGVSHLCEHEDWASLGNVAKVVRTVLPVIAGIGAGLALVFVAGFPLTFESATQLVVPHFIAHFGFFSCMLYPKASLISGLGFLIISLSAITFADI